MQDILIYGKGVTDYLRLLLVLVVGLPLTRLHTKNRELLSNFDLDQSQYTRRSRQAKKDRELLPNLYFIYEY